MSFSKLELRHRSVDGMLQGKSSATPRSHSGERPLRARLQPQRTAEAALVMLVAALACL